LPSVFEARALEAKADRHQADLLMGLPGGEALLRERDASASILGLGGRQPPSAGCIHGYLPKDEARDNAARGLHDSGQIGVPVFQDQSLTFVFDCLSSLAIIGDPAPVTYTVFIGLDGHIDCSCADFRGRQGAACKHVRAALLRLQDLRQKAGLQIPRIKIPLTRMEALTRFCDSLGSNDCSGPSGCTLPSLSVTPTGSSSTRPDIRAAQLVEDILSESGDTEVIASDCELGPGDASTTSPHPQGSSETAQAPVDSQPATASMLVELPSMSLEISRAGLHRQTLARVLYELESQGPRLREYSGLLCGVRLTHSEVPRVRAVQEDLDMLSAQLSELLRDTVEPVPVARSLSAHSTLMTHPHTPLEPDGASRYRKRRASAVTLLLPPSPEKSQKRQDSHSIH
ncbi:hypothetical protein PYCCODRAFT_1343946, partial [Trametes coccinea BRFM310]